MAVSLALLGYGASGSILTVFSALAQPRYWAAFAFAQSLATSIAYLLSNALPFDSYSIAWDARQVIYLALFPLGFLLGTLFPKGIAYLEERPPALIPWAWGINGATSVISAIGSALLALTFGFTFVMACGAVCYGLGALLVKGTKRTSPKLSAGN